MRPPEPRRQGLHPSTCRLTIRRREPVDLPRNAALTCDNERTFEESPGDGRHRPGSGRLQGVDVDNATVSCSCGRKMMADALRGYGAFRCGCGVRVKVVILHRATCGAIEDDAPCRSVPVTNSSEHSLYLCKKHLAEFEERIEEVKASAADERATRAYWEYEEELAREHNQAQRSRREMAIEKARSEGRVVVYYIRIGDYIKIGTTTNLRMRMSILQPDEVLATEPGYTEVESMRHQQFRHLRIRPKSERFHPAQELLEHIEMIRGHYGEPSDRFEVDTPRDAA